MNLFEGATVGDFDKIVKQVLMNHGLHSLLPLTKNVDFMRVKLESLENMFRIRSIDFTDLAWVQDIYRS